MSKKQNSRTRGATRTDMESAVVSAVHAPEVLSASPARRALDRAVLTPEMVIAVLAEFAVGHEDGPLQWAVEDDLDYVIEHTGGYGLVASQLARQALAAGVDWRAWVGSVVGFFIPPESPPRMGTIEAMTVSALSAIFKSVQTKALDMACEATRDEVLFSIDLQTEREDGRSHAYLYASVARLAAIASVWVVHMEECTQGITLAARLATKTAALERMAREIASDVVYLRGPQEAAAFIAFLRTLSVRAKASAGGSKAASRRSATL